MRVLVMCEESQTVCKAFRAKGHDAHSCDLLPAGGGHPEWHIVSTGDEHSKDILSWNWELMIGHPPCTYLTITANRWMKEQPKLKSGILVGAERKEAQKHAVAFFMMLANAPIPKICIENPIGAMSKFYRKPDQIIHPYYFGDPYEKSTCLWLKGLPKLIHVDKNEGLFASTPTHVVPEERLRWVSKGGQNKSQPTWYAKASQKDGNRGKIRSKTFEGIAKAMAEQWG